MPSSLHGPLTLLIFLAMLVLVVVRPRGWSEAWWTVLAAAAMLALRLVTPSAAWAATLDGKTPLLFLLSLLLLSLLIGKSGFFDWTALHGARLAKCDGRALYRNTFLLGAFVTATLSLDTTAVILTPIVLALVKRLKLPSAPYIVLCAFVANVGSLALPVSNLTNIIFCDAFHFSFPVFARAMLLPQVAALGGTFALLRWQFRRELPARFDDDELGSPSSVVPNRPYFVLSVIGLGVVLVGYFVAPYFGIEPYVVAFACSALLAVVGIATKRIALGDLREVSWGVFPFVIGLFIAVQGLEGLGVVDVASEWLTHLKPGSPAKIFAAAAGTTLASNIMNNLPAALLARSVLAAANAHPATLLAALIGADVGPLITPFGSLATMLVFSLARREGEEVPLGRFLVFALWATPLLVAVTTLTLALSFDLVK